MINVRELPDKQLAEVAMEADKAVQDSIKNKQWDRRDYWLGVYKNARQEMLKRELDSYYTDAYSSDRVYEEEEGEPIRPDDVSTARWTGFRGI